MTQNVTARSIAAWLFYWSGGFWLWRRLHRDKVIIVAIHGTGDPGCSAEWTPLRKQLSSSELERILRLLAPNYTFVSLGEAVAMIKGEAPMKANAMAFTFDDGYRSNVKFALPVLKRFGVRPIIFLATHHNDKKVPHWFDRLDFALQSAKADGREIVVGGMKLRIDGGTRDGLANSFSEIRRRAKKADRDDREMLEELGGIALELEKESSRALVQILDTDDWSSVLNWDEVRSAQSDVDFGSHTVDHVRIGKVRSEIALEQLQKSKQRIESESGGECRYFAYPDGNYSQTAMDLCRQAGYEAAVTMDPGMNGRSTDCMALKRIAVPMSGSNDEILAELSGFWNWFRG